MKVLVGLRLGLVAGCVVVVLVVAQSAWAAGGQEAGKAPLTITSFTMEPTRGTSISKVGNTRYATIVNEPYERPFTQAGAHPWGLTTTIEFAHEPLNIPEDEGFVPTAEPKDVVVGLPPGLLGNPDAVPRCTLTQAFALGECRPDSQVGVFRVRWLDGKQYVGPIMDVIPEKGQSAEFAFVNEAKVSAALTGHLVRTPETVNAAGVRVPGSYELTVSSNGIPTVGLYRIETTFWGVPADSSHDAMRGLLCAANEPHEELTCKDGTDGQASGAPLVPFLTLSTDCAAGPETATLRADSWEAPGSVREQHYEGYTEAQAVLPAVTGCDLLSFAPEIAVRPDTEEADAPVGLDVGLKVPLSEEPEASATPQLRDASVTFPEGVSVNPSVVDGIRACNEFGPEGINITGPESEVESRTGELQLAPGHCPDASVIGTAEAITPLLSEPVRGRVYLARPGCGGTGQAACTDGDALDGNLYRVYLELGGEGELASTGVHIKVEGRTEVNPATGQLTTVFDDNPQTPFSELKIDLNGGPRAPIANPAVCGRASTTTDFMPWSAPGITPEGISVAGTPDATPSSFYNVEPGGCGGVSPFNPGFLAGTVSSQAGQFSAFTMNLTRHDREQYVKGVQVHTPPGLLAMLSSVPLCPEAQADDPGVNGECTASKIGTTRVATGAGSHPFEVEGNVYLTGPYGGAPFGLSIVTRAVAGPFNLGLVVVRARIDIDPVSSTATITTDETGPYALPQIIFGVPLRLKQVTVNIDRQGFMFNPTNCGAQQIEAKISGSQNAVASVSSGFAVGGCKSLEFKPKFTVSTSAKTSKQNGASLDAKVTYPLFVAGSDANIAKVKVDLPRLLPSRLTTLQKACTSKQFDENPANCPNESKIGYAKVNTPLLPVPLEGPAVFVSHGDEAFPSLEIVLQGDGVTVVLVGATLIKNGVTSTTFNTVPDTPFSTFELYLPEGPYSALAADGNLCKETIKVSVKKKVRVQVNGKMMTVTRTVKEMKPSSVVMPNEFVGQNGAVIKQTTPIKVIGCPPTRAKPASQKKAKKKTKQSSHGKRSR